MEYRSAAYGNAPLGRIPPLIAARLLAAGAVASWGTTATEGFDKSINVKQTISCLFNKMLATIQASTRFPIWVKASFSYDGNILFIQHPLALGFAFLSYSVVNLCDLFNRVFHRWRCGG